MIKEVSYKGISSVPSDFLCPDGDNAMLMNLVPEDGAIKPILPPETVMVLPSEKRVVYIRTVHNDKHYIIHDANTNTIEWTTDGKTFVELLRLEDAEMYEVKGIGNTIIALTNKGMEYLLWKGEQGYIYLGDKIPELSLSFGLQGEMKRTEEFPVSFENVLFHAKQKTENGVTFLSFAPFNEEDQKKITEQVLAKVNKFLADNSTKKGKFIYPFFVRYALRLYDGTLTHHSAPILMVCSTQCTPIALWDKLNYWNPAKSDAMIRIVGMFHSLDYAVNNNAELNELRHWSDIVKSVDVFISKPIYTYDQNGQCDKIYNYHEYGVKTWGYSTCKHINRDSSLSAMDSFYEAKSIGYLYRATFDAANIHTLPGGVLGLPRKSEASIREEIKNCANFYLLESINIDKLKTERTLIDVEDDYLQSLVNREVMKDDYDSHDTLIPQYAFSYNQRLNIANLQKKLFKGFDAASMFCYTDGEQNYNNTHNDNPTRPVRVHIYIKQDAKDIIVTNNISNVGQNSPKLFIYYPNINAYKAVVVVHEYFDRYFEVPLQKHNFLNGAFYFDGWEDAKEVSYINVPKTDNTVNIPNKIYTSEVNNPFHFPLLGINTVGTGKIMGICSAVKALSEGQFGQFPLYAFSTDGVWALELSGNGLYSVKQPVTRDVCINPKSITQIDTAVLFATSRGIMMLQGAETECVSDILYGDNTSSVKHLPKYNELVGLSGLVSESLNIIPFKDYVKDCRMLYDYEHQRIIVYNPSSENKYSYVLSLKSKQWGMSEQNIIYSVNSYPDAMAVLDNSRLVNFSKEEDALTDDVLITRPMTLGEVNVFKTVNGVIQRGFFRKGRVRSVLYGSNDLFHWFVVWSSRDHYLRGFSGSPYKYHRIALLCTLQGDESLLGCSVDYRERINNQIR